MADPGFEARPAASHRSHPLGLSPRARRAVLWMVLIALIAIPLSYGLGRAAGDSPIRAGGDLVVMSPDADHLWIGGEWGGARLGTGEGFRPIETLARQDVMGWAVSGPRVLAGTHYGLFMSADHGASFASNRGVPVNDVHGVGAAGQVVYVAAADGAIWVSQNGGVVFSQVGTANASVMGSIWVDPANPSVAIAPSMDAGALITTTGGVRWKPLGGPSEALSVAVDRGGQRIVILSRHGAQISQDGGKRWAALPLPPDSLTVSYDQAGALVVGAWRGDRVAVLRQNGTTWQSLGTTDAA